MERLILERTKRQKEDAAEAMPCYSGKKVGIVVVSYNSSTAVRLTIASLRKAQNDTPWELMLIDNASTSKERSLIHNSFEKHARTVGKDWHYVEQEKNLGFAGGNNIGIRFFLKDPSITHICLLNSDVIVSDHWLDRLIEKESPLISGVTCRADGEQAIPVEYSMAIEDCFDTKGEDIFPKSFEIINDYAQKHYATWRGNVVEAEPTFFCVLISRTLFEAVGLLDETFFPGGFEDDDYCIRAKKAGYTPSLARDVYIHHWGNSSFGKLNWVYVSKKALQNRQYLEKKHDFVWQQRFHKPVVAYAQDILFALAQKLPDAQWRPYEERYRKNLTPILTAFEHQFTPLQRRLEFTNHFSREISVKLHAAQKHPSLLDTWGEITQIVDTFSATELTDSAHGETLAQLQTLLSSLELAVYDVASCIAVATPQVATSMHARLMNRFRKIWNGLIFLTRLHGVVFFGGYPYPERDGDGYFQRIRAIDALFSSGWRVYVDPFHAPGREHWNDLPERHVLVLRLRSKSRKGKCLARILALLCAFRVRKVYFHSVLRMEDCKFGRLMRIPFFMRIFDMHGVVPEEFRLHNDFFSALIYEKHERLAVRKADTVIAVTHAMRDYLLQKYPHTKVNKIVIFPIYPQVPVGQAKKAYANAKPVVVYAGGLQKWQEIPKMIDAIIRAQSKYAYRFYCPEPSSVQSLLPEELRNSPDMVLASVPHSKLLELYAECHFGFLLRQDSVVNHVACPTKLVEYLAMGIVPILDSEAVGDFTSYGMRYIKLSDFIDGQVPDETTRNMMAQENLLVYDRLKQDHLRGGEQLKRLA